MFQCYKISESTLELVYSSDDSEAWFEIDNSPCVRFKEFPYLLVKCLKKNEYIFSYKERCTYIYDYYHWFEDNYKPSITIMDTNQSKILWLMDSPYYIHIYAKN
jgi:hypothetical protein